MTQEEHFSKIVEEVRFVSDELGTHEIISIDWENFSITLVHKESGGKILYQYKFRKNGKIKRFSKKPVENI